MDLRSLKPLLGWSAPLVAAMLTTGCGSYTSEYVPPKDGRARAVWHEDRVVASMPDRANSAGCSVAVNEVQADPVVYRSYYGGSPSIIIWQPWVVVRSSNRASPSVRPRTAANPTAISKGGSGGGGGGSFGGGSSGGGSGGGSGNMGEAAVVLVVVAMLTLPIITLGLGLSRPEPEGQVAQEIDKVNAFNDLARLSDSPCGEAVGAQ